MSVLSVKRTKIFTLADKRRKEGLSSNEKTQLENLKLEVKEIERSQKKTRKTVKGLNLMTGK